MLQPHSITPIMEVTTFPYISLEYCTFPKLDSSMVIPQVKAM